MFFIDMERIVLLFWGGGICLECRVDGFGFL